MIMMIFFNDCDDDCDVHDVSGSYSSYHVAEEKCVHYRVFFSNANFSAPNTP